MTTGPAPHGYGLGVDLGTTRTAAAVRMDGRVEVVRLGGHRHEIPSLVYVRADGEILIGDAAERRGASEPERLAREFKRRVGDQVKITLGGAEYSAPALMTLLLRDVIATVTRQRESAPDAVTVTHPANWTAFKRDRLAEAFRAAGLDDVLFRSEPEAIAVQYAAGERIRPDEIVAVYDLGGGTFDTAVLRKTAIGFELLGEPKGVDDLGGSDFDEEVYAHVAGALDGAIDRLDPDDEAVVEALARLRLDCVVAKEALSFDTDVMIPVALPGLHTRVRLNRSEFEARIAPRLDETVEAMRGALRSAATTPAELKCVLLAGGSSRIPLVGQLLTAAFDRPTVLDPHPEHSVALGAALLTGVPTAQPPPAQPPPVQPPPAQPPPVQASRAEALPSTRPIERISGSTAAVPVVAPVTPVGAPAGSGTSTSGPVAASDARAFVAGRARVPDAGTARTLPTPGPSGDGPSGDGSGISAGRDRWRAWWRKAVGHSPRSRWLIPFITALALVAVSGGVQYALTHGDTDLRPPADARNPPSAMTTSPSPSPSPPDSTESSDGGTPTHQSTPTRRTRTKKTKSTYSTPKHVIPSVDGLSTAEAAAKIAGTGFTEEPAIVYEPNEMTDEGHVLRVDPKAGSSHPKDTRITLYVAAPKPSSPEPLPMSSPSDS